MSEGAPTEALRRAQERVRTVAELSTGVALVFVVGPSLRGGEALRALAEVIPEEWVRAVHRLNGPNGVEMDAALPPSAEDAKRLLMVIGLESLGARAQREVLAGLNFRRDRLRERAGVVLFWIPEDLLQTFRRACRDLFSWRAALISLSDEDLGAPEAALELVRGRREAVIAEESFAAADDDVLLFADDDEAVTIEEDEGESWDKQQGWLPEVLPVPARSTPDAVAAAPSAPPVQSGAQRSASPSQSNTTLVLGEAGSGKSALLRRASHRMFERLAEPIASTAEDFGSSALPLTVPAKELKPHLQMHDLAAAIASATGDRTGQPLVPDALRALLTDGAFAVMIDGLDELPTPEERARLTQLIDDAGRSYPNTSFTLTSRPWAAQVPDSWTRTYLSAEGTSNVTRTADALLALPRGRSHELATEALYALFDNSDVVEVTTLPRTRLSSDVQQLAHEGRLLKRHKDGVLRWLPEAQTAFAAQAILDLGPKEASRLAHAHAEDPEPWPQTLSLALGQLARLHHTPELPIRALKLGDEFSVTPMDWTSPRVQIAIRALEIAGLPLAQEAVVSWLTEARERVNDATRARIDALLNR